MTRIPIIALLLSLTGCNSLAVLDKDGMSIAAAMIAVIDADEDTFQLALPDSLNKGGGDSGSAGGERHDPPPVHGDMQDATPPAKPVALETIVSRLPKAGWSTVHFYCRSHCAPCEAAKAALQAAGIPFEVRNPPAWVQEFPSMAWKDPTSRNGWSYHIGFYGFEAFFADYSPSTEAPEAGQSPTPLSEVRRLLAILRPQPHEVFADFGCGDGRWLIEAARTYGCRAVGVEIDPAQVAKARQAVADAGLSGRVQIIEGDAATVDVQANVGVAYLYSDALARLQPKLLKLNRFATYMHRVDGIAMQQSGDAWIWSRPVVQPMATQQRYAYYGGQSYSGPVCNNPRCQMCNAIRQQLGYCR